MSSNKSSNPWMPASNGVFGGGSDYNKNAYSVRGKGAANNPWVQGSGWWEESVEGNYQKGFGQATQSNEYYSTEPVSLQAMRRMRTITVLVAGGAILGAAAAAGLFSGGGGAAAAGGAAATTTGGSGAALGSGGLFAGGGVAGTGITTAQALTTAGSVVGGVMGNSLLSSQGASAGQGSGQMGNASNADPGGNTPMNALNNPLTPGWPPTQPSGNPQPNQHARNRRRRRREESEGENLDTSDYDFWEKQYQVMTRNTMRSYGMSYGGNGSYAKTTGREGYGNKSNTNRNSDQNQEDRNEDYKLKRIGTSSNGNPVYEVNKNLEIIEKRPAHLNNQPLGELQKMPWLAPEGFGNNANPWANRGMPDAAGIYAGTIAQPGPNLRNASKIDPEVLEQINTAATVLGFKLDVINSGTKQAIKLSKNGSKEIIEKEAEILFKNIRKITGPASLTVGLIGPAISGIEMYLDPTKITTGNIARIGVFQVLPILVTASSGPFAPLVGLGFVVLDLNLGQDFSDGIDSLFTP